MDECHSEARVRSFAWVVENALQFEVRDRVAAALEHGLLHLSLQDFNHFLNSALAFARKTPEHRSSNADVISSHRYGLDDVSSIPDASIEPYRNRLRSSLFGEGLDLPDDRAKDLDRRWGRIELPGSVIAHIDGIGIILQRQPGVFRAHESFNDHKHPRILFNSLQVLELEAVVLDVPHELSDTRPAFGLNSGLLPHVNVLYIILQPDVRWQAELILDVNDSFACKHCVRCDCKSTKACFSCALEYIEKDWCAGAIQMEVFKLTSGILER